MQRLTENQLRFAKLIADGSTQAKAYAEAYSSQASTKALGNMAHSLYKKPHVRAEIDRLRPRKQATPTSDTLQTDEYRRILASVARDATATPIQRMKAVEMDAKLVGVFGKATTQEDKEKAELAPGSPEFSLLLNAAAQALQSAPDKAE